MNAEYIEFDTDVTPEFMSTNHDVTPVFKTTSVAVRGRSGRHALHTVGWSLGTVCPFGCDHCYTKSTRGVGSDLDRERVERIADAIAASGASHVVLGGNEPIYTPSLDVRKSFLPKIIERLHGAGVGVALITAGPSVHALARRWPDMLERLSIVAVSIDSPFAEEHDGHRKASLFSVATRSLQVLQDRGVPSSVILPAMDWNFDEVHLRAFLELADSYRAYLRVNVLKTAVGSASRAPNPANLVAGLRLLIESTTSVVTTEPVVAALLGQERAIPVCGRSSVRINLPDADGSIGISSCQYLGRDGALKLETNDLLSVLERFGPAPSAAHPACRAAHHIDDATVVRTSRASIADDPEVEAFRRYLCTWVGRSWSR